MIKAIDKLRYYLTGVGYVISTDFHGVTYYYLGKPSMWTPLLAGAKVYKTRPDFEWATEDYEIQKVYTGRN